MLHISKDQNRKVQNRKAQNRKVQNRKVQNRLLQPAVQSMLPIQIPHSGNHEFL